MSQDVKTMFPWTRALARRLLPRSRYSRILLSCALATALMAWALSDRPWEAHYRGRPSSHWADVLLAEDFARSGRPANMNAPGGLLDSVRVLLDNACEPEQKSSAEFEPVLEELLHHRNPEVRRIAAERLANYGDRGFGNALPTLLERLRGQPDADSRLHAARTIRAFSHYGRNILRSQVPELLECHRAEASQSVRWAIVELLRAIDLKAVNGLPVTRDLVFLEDPSGRTVADGWQTEPDTERSGVVWKLVVDSTRPSRSDYVLAQIAGTSDTSIHACLTEPSIHAKTTPLNVEISVSIKAIAGSQQQGGGIAWRHLGPDNYYAVGLNALDGSVRLFKVVDGQCVELASRGGLDVSPGKWHRLTVQHVRAKIWCSLDEAKCLEITDVPITNQGSFGLWTRADAKTHFDGVRVADFASGIVPESP